MDKLIWFALIGIVSLWLASILEQFGFERGFEIEPNGLEMTVGIIGASVWVYLYGASESR